MSLGAPDVLIFLWFGSHLLFYLLVCQTPQSPLVRPIAHDELAVDNYALGTNAIVAVISYTVSVNE